MGVELQKVILYYRFAPIADPEAMRLWQETLCQSLGLKGRIIISKDGINGTLGGDMSALKRYVTECKKYPGFNKIDFKWSDGTGNDFPRLKIRVRDELVSFGSPENLIVDENGVVGAGKHLNPYEVHKLVEERGSEVVFFDGRNAFEAKIGNTDLTAQGNINNLLGFFFKDDDMDGVFDLSSSKFAFIKVST